MITQLRDAKNLIEQLEQDKVGEETDPVLKASNQICSDNAFIILLTFQGMVIAETKRQMHETLEMKEDEIAQLRSRLQQVTAQKEELQEQKEKAEKSGW